jgi:amidohydrolase
LTIDALVFTPAADTANRAVATSPHDPDGRHCNPMSSPGPVVPDLASVVEQMRDVRRDLHAHPELAGAEFRTTALVADRLASVGLVAHPLPGGCGLICDVPAEPVEDLPRTLLRADLDALPLRDTKDVPYRSTVEDACHACGHDLHTAVVLGAGLVLATQPPAVPVRLVFQPAEEAMWGARAAIDAGALKGVGRAFALHADPRLDVGSMGLRVGSITGAADFVSVRLHGPGGHTARPHLTADLIHVLGIVATSVPAMLRERVDPRSGLRLVWGRVQAGSAPNAIPSTGELAGTMRCLDAETWETAPRALQTVVEELAARHGVRAEIEVTRGVPPCVNDETAVAAVRAAVTAEFGAAAAVTTEQSLGGEDFAWFLRSVPGALVRLGTRGPGTPAVDLHQPAFDIDEAAIEVGIRTLVAVARGTAG